MKKVLYSVLLAAVAGFGFTACSNGDYSANPNSAVNASINPLAPLDSAALSAFVVAGTPNIITATINGAAWSAHGDTGAYYFFDTGVNYITGISGGKYLTLSLKNVYGGSIYGMGHNNFITFGELETFDTTVLIDVHASFEGNSGEVQILENDNAFIKGTFYFQAVDSLGDVINVNNGYFYLKKD